MKTTIACCVLLVTMAHSAAFAQLNAEIDVKVNESNRNLRDAIVKLKDVRVASCTMRRGANCDLVAISDVMLVLLDIEYKYSRAGRRASGPTAERFNKIKDAASEAMSAVSDLEDAFEKE